MMRQTEYKGELGIWGDWLTPDEADAMADMPIGEHRQGGLPGPDGGRGGLAWGVTRREAEFWTVQTVRGAMLSGVAGWRIRDDEAHSPEELRRLLDWHKLIR